MKEINNRKFYSANVAYNLSKQIEEDKQYEELSEVFDQIDIYVATGKYECHMVKLTEFQENWLKNNGYHIEKVNRPDHYTHGLIKISWK